LLTPSPLRFSREDRERIYDLTLAWRAFVACKHMLGARRVRATVGMSTQERKTCGYEFRQHAKALRKSSDNGDMITSSHGSLRRDDSIHASAGELTEIADLQPIVMNEGPKNVDILR
jgi:hypothetical protein